MGFEKEFEEAEKELMAMSEEGTYQETKLIDITNTNNKTHLNAFP